MPLLLLWHPRVPHDVQVPTMELEIVGYTRRWTVEDTRTRWTITGYTRRFQVIVSAARWVVMETRRILWRRE